MHHDVAAEAVADEVDALAGREGVEQRLEIGDVVGEPIALRLPGAAAEAAQIRRDRVPVARQRVDEELERRADVHPAVQQEQLRRRRVAPGQHVVVVTAQRDAVRAIRLHRARLPGRRGCRRRATRCEQTSFIAPVAGDFQLAAAHFRANRAPVLPSGAVVAVGREARRVLALAAARAGAAVGVALAIGQRKARQVDGRRRRFRVGRRQRRPGLRRRA